MNDAAGVLDQSNRVEVRFHPDPTFRWYKLIQNSFRLLGEGSVAATDGSVAVSGTRWGAFGRTTRKSLDFQTSAIANVEQRGNVVRFEIANRRRAPKVVMCWCSDEADARRLVALLPTTRNDHHGNWTQQAQFDDELKRRTPNVYVTPVLVAANIVVFVAMAFAGAGLADINPLVHIAWGSNLGVATLAGEWWRLFTCMFIHFGLLHLVVNMWALSIEGRVVERMYGSIPFVVLYVLSGLAGSVASIAWNPLVNSAGASGAIFGVFGALFAAMTGNRVRMPAAVLRAYLSSTATFVFVNLVYGLSHSGIDNAAHIGGFVAGYAVGLMLRGPRDGDVRFRRTALRVGLTAVVSVALLVAASMSVQKTNAGVLRDEDLRAELRWFLENEPANLATFNTIAELARNGEIADAAFADRIESEVQPFWEEAASRFAVAQDAEDHELAKTLATFGRYTAFRQSAMAEYVQAGRQFDANRVATANALMQDAQAELDAIGKIGSETPPSGPRIDE